MRLQSKHSCTTFLFSGQSSRIRVFNLEKQSWEQLDTELPLKLENPTITQLEQSWSLKLHGGKQVIPCELRYLISSGGIEAKIFVLRFSFFAGTDFVCSN